MAGHEHVANAIGHGLVAALSAIPEDDWPTGDLFGSYGFLQPIPWQDAVIGRIQADVLGLLGVDVQRARTLGVVAPAGGRFLRGLRRPSRRRRP